MNSINELFHEKQFSKTIRKFCERNLLERMMVGGLAERLGPEGKSRRSFWFGACIPEVSRGVDEGFRWKLKFLEFTFEKDFLHEVCGFLKSDGY